MTRFCGDAIGVRGGRPTGLTGKDIKKNMQTFIETGIHPDVVSSRAQAKADSIPPLPEHDANREFMFLELKQGGEDLGRLVIELYGDHIAVGANHLRNRCLPGSKAGLTGCTIHKLQQNYAIWLGKNPAASEGMRIQSNPKLRHVDIGAVSISFSGDEVAISLGRALVLDSTHQVVGQVHKGLDILEGLNHTAINHNDVPLRPIKVTKTGTTNAAGAYEELDAEAADFVKDPAARLAAQSQSTRNAVKDALVAAGLGKRKLEPPPNTASGSKQAGKDQARGTGSRNVVARKEYMDFMLGDDDTSSSDGDSDSKV
eukprot:CAMPEP_0119105896 /NCGR_PEP_ID=MMETSP1180-20130426/3736_1 /TAXON_ID=3052 ORGANISM="Chlamydomonas cf sp, Strain CCMP681" /NCGR_SAMPLE_ID=MMETSP1180 /ASSEMBLY_ACC=CAM_ASM_000741 /LENGTH=313 /DNA_ID=CAMNT_0007091073 /DNA_START=26 /DNA_END=967 /DNA_ORIENTATION=+